ncbi:asparagine--tRNA ligase [Rubinisphaera sp.]|uniref:asparagine--tRNA ligase n=2 Tax=Rubinisphaera TaxID=1649490 RepID=UPI000C11B262|nr:asparagine--tRNA ligase [Rubinisphaera sp.]MBV09847.1 asparagine--tRNA ligase [Rubinisphaera sp.]HCS50821.1 asparagine--tRNA ligase [Planctomycetaceae bacterium]|tara:strand:- start:7627 stop:9012 length:1386 start_codon:yes stop_codon:yes gene_type:complete
MARIKEVRDERNPGEELTVNGWVRTRRDSKQGFAFIELNDGSCLGNLQIVVDQETKGFAESTKEITTGAALTITGTLKESPGKGQRVELHASELKVLGTADPETFPLQKKRHSFEYLREIAHLRPRSNTFSAIARVRNAASAAIHNFFQERHFLYVHTPIITTSDCEGAGQMFRVTTLDLARLAGIQTEIDYSQDFFGKAASLTVSGQLEAEIYATSTGPCYTFGPTFRAENSNTTRHLAEFWMVEPEIPFFDLNDNMQLAQDFIKHVISHVLETCAEDMEFFNQRIEKTVLETLQHIVDHDFERVSYTDAIEILTSSKKEWEFPVEWGHDLQSEHERFLTEEHFKKPIILFDYPRTIKPFYMRCNDDGKTVRAMDVLVPRIGEIIGGSQREERLDVLEARMKECDLDPEEYWWYLDLRRYGTVPHAGFGLGFERLIQLLTGMQNIRDCIPFPRTPKNAEF